MLQNYAENALSVKVGLRCITQHDINQSSVAISRTRPEAQISAVFFVFCVITGTRYGRARNNYRLNRARVAANIHTCKGFGRRLKKTSPHHSPPVYLPVPQRTGAPLSHPPSAFSERYQLVVTDQRLTFIPKGNLSARLGLISM